MSLINEALQDLAARENGVPAAEKIALLPQGSRKKPLLTLGPLSLCFSALAVSAFFYVAYDTKSELKAVQSTFPASAAASVETPQVAKNTEMPVVKTQSALAVADPVEAKINNHKTASAQINQNDKIEALLANADAAIAKSRLSRPAEANALFYINKVLAIDENNAQAQALLHRASERYRNILVSAIEAPIDEKSLTRARRLLSRASLFDISLDEQAGMLAQLTKKESEIALISSAPEIKPNKLEELAVKKPQVIKLSDEADPASYFSLSTEQQDLNALQHAKNTLAKSGVEAAIIELNSINEAHRSFYHTRIFASDLLLAENRDDDVRRMLESSNSSHPAYRYLKARLLVLDMGEDIAIDYLRKGKALKLHEKSFLAAMYQKTQRSQEAFFLYQDLLREDSKNDKYLLGFAVSADALGKHSQSAQAYRAVLQHAEPNGKVVEFIKARLAQLKTDELAEARAW